jgi:predicted nucleic acid-binding protein
MHVKIFVDTNVLLYAWDIGNPEKSQQAALWLRITAQRGQPVVNLQVLNEFCHVAFRKLRTIAVEDVFSIVDTFIPWGNEGVTYQTVLIARTIKSRYAFSWFDCLLLASAQEQGCQYFLSEDMQDEQKVDSIRILNPFRHHPAEIFTLN